MNVEIRVHACKQSLYRTVIERECGHCGVALLSIFASHVAYSIHAYFLPVNNSNNKVRSGKSVEIEGQVCINTQ